jgi:Arc/MetJ-type ribon-helix-helix transcriptional regulator
MPIIHVPDEVKEIIDRHVAEGSAASEADFVSEAVLRHADHLEYDEGEIIAAAWEGLDAMRRGEYTTVDSPEAQRAFWDQIALDVKQEVAKRRGAATPSVRGRAQANSE